MDLCWNYPFFFHFFSLKCKISLKIPKRGIYELYQGWTAAEQGSHSFASPLKAQAQKLYCEME